MSGVAGFVAKWTATMLIIDVSHASTKHQSASSTAPSQNTVMFISIAKSIGTIIMKKALRETQTLRAGCSSV